MCVCRCMRYNCIFVSSALSVKCRAHLVASLKKKGSCVGNTALPRPQLEAPMYPFKHREASHKRADPIVQVLRALHRRSRLKTSGACDRICK